MEKDELLELCVVLRSKGAIVGYTEESIEKGEATVRLGQTYYNVGDLGDALASLQVRQFLGDVSKSDILLMRLLEDNNVL